MVRHYNTGEWTDERFDLAARLWKNGLSATQIAKQLGGVSRSAVLGKLGRAKLLGTRAKPSAPAKAPQMPSVRRANNGRIYRQPPPVPLPAPRLVDDGTTAKPWLVRAFGECAYPVSGDGADAYSCCATVKGGSPYCQEHFDLMYAPRAPSKKKGEKRWFNALAQRYAA